MENGIISDKIANVTNYKDELTGFNDVLGVERQVKIYQWVENKEFLEDKNRYVYSYFKKWVEEPVDSTAFYDRSKNNSCGEKNTYQNKYFLVDKIVTKQNGYFLDKKYFSNKIHFKDVEFKDGTVIYGTIIKKKVKKINVEQENDDSGHIDLDYYVSSMNKSTVVKSRDKFIAYNNILTNSKDIEKPEICDNIIKYRVFNPKNVLALGAVKDKKIVPYDDFILVEFDKSINNKFLIIRKLRFLSVIIVIISLIIFVTSFILYKLRIHKTFTLKRVPFFNEYLVYSRWSNFNTMCVVSIVLLISVHYTYFIAVPIALLIIAKNIDYYSI